MILEIACHVGVGAFRFGMTATEVRSIASAPFKSFNRTPESKHPADHFQNLQMFAYYTEDGELEALEFYRPANLLFHGVRLLELGFGGIIDQLKKIDHSIDVQADGFTAYELGVGAYAPEAEDDSSKPPESMIVFADGYYD